MLVLCRKLEEEVVVIGPDGVVLGTLKLTKCQRDRAWIGFEFPPEIKVHRREVWERIQEEGPRE